MKDEITAAAAFLTRLVTKKGTWTPEETDRFQQELIAVLYDKFAHHWFPDRPSRGQAYRCIRINEVIRHEPALEQVCENLGLSYRNDLSLPLELTLWIDPEEVACRFGEHKGSYCVVAAFREGNKENYVHQINVDELELRSQERARQASFDMVNNRKRKLRQSSYLNQHKPQMPHHQNIYQSSSNGLYSSVDYNNGLVTTATNANYYGQPQQYYQTPKYNAAYPGAPSPHNMHQSAQPLPGGGGLGGMSFGASNGGYGTSHSISPPNRGASTYNRSTGLYHASSAAYGPKYPARGLHSAFNNVASTLSYSQPQPQSFSQPQPSSSQQQSQQQQQQTNDRYHWNKPIVKA